MSKVCIPKFSFAVYLFNAFGKCLPLTPWAQYLSLHTIDENSKKWKWEPVSFYLWVISQTLYKCKITYDHKRNNQPVRLTEEQQFHFVCLVSNQKPTHPQLVSTLTTKKQVYLKRLNLHDSPIFQTLSPDKNADIGKFHIRLHHFFTPIANVF